MSPFIRTLSLSACLIAATTVSNAALAVSSTAVATLDGIFVTTDGTAAVTFTGADFLTALGTTTAGIPDGFSDGELFASEVGPFGEGTATNAGFGDGLSSMSLADVGLAGPGSALSSATTFAELGYELEGTGNVTFELTYTLEVDAFGSDIDGFAEAMIDAYTTFEPGASTMLAASGIGAGEFDVISDSLFISFFFDDFGFGPVTETLFIETLATSGATVVPVPAALWLLGPAMLGLTGMRRRAVN